MTTVALVDDHVLLRNSLATIINNFEGFKVLLEADNGQHFIEQVAKNVAPNVVLLDISMPVMDGYETAMWIRIHLPMTNILVLSMMDSDRSVIRMINHGARGYILKDSKPAVLKEALESISSKGFYSNDLISSKMMYYVNNEEKRKKDPVVTAAASLNAKEITFLKQACSEKTYKEIADAMHVSPRTIDTYRDALFEKLQLKSRVGMVLFAIREGIVQV
ncbi:MAG: response regulator transcription factor [Ginsengibacter sp.]